MTATDLGWARKRRAGLADDGRCAECGQWRVLCRGHPTRCLHERARQAPPYGSPWFLTLPPPRCVDCGQNLYDVAAARTRRDRAVLVVAFGIDGHAGRHHLHPECLDCMDVLRTAGEVVRDLTRAELLP